MTKEEAVELLRGGPDGVGRFNKFIDIWANRVDWAKSDDSNEDDDFFDLTGVDLSGCDLRGVRFRRVDLTSAVLDGAVMVKATIETPTRMTDVSLVGARLDKARVGKVHMDRSDLTRASLRGAELGGSILCEATLRQASLESVELNDVQLTDADLSKADLTGAWYIGSTVLRASFVDATGCFGVAAMHPRRVKGDSGQTKTVRLTFEEFAIHRPKCERRIGWITNWGFLRLIALLRLRGISLVMLPLFIAYVLAAKYYNEQIIRLREWSSEQEPQAAFHWLGRLQAIEVSEWYAWQIGAWIAAVIGAFVYWGCCPDIVKEYTREQFVYEQNRPLFEYQAALWGHRWWRYACLVLAGSGFLHTAVWLVWKACIAIHYVWTS
jgi:hypothetical protein